MDTKTRDLEGRSQMSFSWGAPRLWNVRAHKRDEMCWKGNTSQKSPIASRPGN
jgi:hypothetical protein